MLPGNLQYWHICKMKETNGYVRKGTISLNINEPIHFAGPSPGKQSIIDEEEKKEQPKTSQQDKILVANQDESRVAAKQSPPIQRPIEEQTKEPESSQIFQPTGGATMGTKPVDAAPTAQQSTDTNQATLLAVQQQ